MDGGASGAMTDVDVLDERTRPAAVTVLVSSRAGAMEERVADVAMPQLPEGSSLSVLVARAAPVADQVHRLAGTLASMHAGAAREPQIDAVATPAALHAAFARNLAALRRNADGLVPTPVLGEIAGLAERFLAGRRSLLLARIATGQVCEGHGQLIADNVICGPDGPRVVDRVQTDQLRYGDALADVALLAMDLQRLGAPLLARHFLDWYSAAAHEAHPRSLEHFYLAHHALVRATALAMQWRQGGVEAGLEAQRLVTLADLHLRAGEIRLVLVGGLPGTGKSTLAAALAHQLGWALLGSDDMRRQVYGLGPDEHPVAAYREGIFAPRATTAAYAELLTRARRLLEQGVSVILDATWLDPARRAAAADAAELTSSRLIELRCDAPEDVAVERLAQRTASRAAGGPPEVLHLMAASLTPWPSARVVDTTGPVSRAVEEALRATGSATVGVAG